MIIYSLFRSRVEYPRHDQPLIIDFRELIDTLEQANGQNSEPHGPHGKDSGNRRAGTKTSGSNGEEKTNIPKEKTTVSSTQAGNSHQ
jgi:hypothetical protein